MINQTNDRNHTIIRLAQIGDSQQIAQLCEQLGYPTSGAAIEQRFVQIQQNKSHAVYLAERSDQQVVGWVHIYVCPILMTDLQAVIGGLIVDGRVRGCGIGRRLVQYAEAWAVTQGCTSVLVRSNIVRKNAHSFYEKIGYSNIKTSQVFHKAI